MKKEIINKLKTPRKFDMKKAVEEINKIYHSEEFARMYYMQPPKKKPFYDWGLAKYAKRLLDKEMIITLLKEK